MMCESPHGVLERLGHADFIRALCVVVGVFGLSVGAHLERRAVVLLGRGGPGELASI
jgi:hypothetical protein